MRSFPVLVLIALVAALCLSACLASTPLAARHVLSRASDGVPSSPSFPALQSAINTQRISSAVQPSAVWATIVPLIPSYHHGRLYVLSVVAGETVVLCVEPSTLAILRTYALPPTVAVIGLHTASSDLFLLAVELSSSRYSILRLSIETGQVHSSVPLSSPQLFLGVDAAGERLLTAVELGSEVLLLNATTGARIGSYSGGVSPLHVMGGGLHPTNGNMLAVDKDNKTVLVIARETDTVVSVLVLPVNIAAFYSLALSEDGVYAYVLIQVLDFFTIEQFEVATGRLINSSHIERFASQVRFLTATDVDGELWATDVQRLTVDRVQTGSGYQRSVLGSYPIMLYPSAVAVSPSGSSIYVATNAPPVVRELNSTGQEVSSFPLIDVHLCGSAYPASSVSVDLKGNVYIPQCNSTLLIYDSQHTLIASLYTGRNSRPRSCAPTLRGSVYITDDNHPDLLAELDMKTGQRLSSLQGASDAAFFGVAVDTRNGSVWASDAEGMLVYHWAADGTLIATFDVSGNDTIAGQPALLYGIAIDAATSRVIVARSVTDIEGVTASVVLWLDAQTGAVVDTYAVVANGLAVGVGVSADGSTVYATDHNSLAVLLFDNKQQRQVAAAKVTTRTE